MVFTTEKWDSFRQITDPNADAAIADVFANAQGNPMRFLLDLDRVDEAGISSLSDLPTSVQKLFRENPIPDWLSEQVDVEKGIVVSDMVFDDNMVEMVLSLLCKSLPECYAGWRGVSVLAYTGKLGGHHQELLKDDSRLVRRVVETSIFVDHVLQAEHWRGDLPVAIRTIVKIRLFHAGVRRMIDRKGMPDGTPWDHEGLGKPINQEDLVATLLAFSHQCVNGAVKMGARISDRQRRLVLGHWAVVGHYLGVCKELLVEFINRPEELWTDIEKRQFEAIPNHPGIELTEDLTIFMERHLFPSILFKHIPEMIMQKIASPMAKECVLRFEHSDQRIPIMLRVIGILLAVLHRLIDRIPFIGRWLMRLIGRNIEYLAIKQWSGGKRVQITLSQELRGT